MAIDVSEYWDYILEIASQRLAKNQTKQHVPDFGNRLEIQGAAGELAARIFFKLPLDLHKSFDGGIDIRIGEWKIDVKARPYSRQLLHGGCVQFPEWRGMKAHMVFYMAVELAQHFVEPLGFALWHEIKAAPVNFLARVPCHEIPVSELHDVCNIDAYLKSPPTPISQEAARFRPFSYVPRSAG